MFCVLKVYYFVMFFDLNKWLKVIIVSQVILLSPKLEGGKEMKFYTEVDEYSTEVSFDIPPLSWVMNSYYFRDCFVKIDLSMLEKKVETENEEELAETLCSLFLDVAKNVSYTQSGDIVTYSIQPKKLRGFRTLELFEPVIKGQVKHLTAEFKKADYDFTGAVCIELVVDMIYAVA